MSWTFLPRRPTLEPLLTFSSIRALLCCCCSVAQSRLTLCDPVDCSAPGFPVLHHLLDSVQFMSTESVILSNCLILCCPLLLLSSIFPGIRVFSNQLVLHRRWPKHWSFSNSISPSYNIQGSFPLGFTDLLSFQSKGLSRVFFSNTI